MTIEDHIKNIRLQADWIRRAYPRNEENSILERPQVVNATLFENIYKVLKEVNFKGFKKFFTKTDIKHFEETSLNLRDAGLTIEGVMAKFEAYSKDDFASPLYGNERINEKFDQDLKTLRRALLVVQFYYQSDVYKFVLRNLAYVSTEILESEEAKHKELKEKIEDVFTLDHRYNRKEAIKCFNEEEYYLEIRQLIRDLLEAVSYTLITENVFKITDVYDEEESYKERVERVEKWQKIIHEDGVWLGLVAIIEKPKSTKERFEVHATYPNMENEDTLISCVNYLEATSFAYDQAKIISEDCGAPLRLVELMNEKIE